jgi:hypothetical protein
MSTSPLMWQRIFISIMVGGGVRGAAIGTVRGSIIQVGSTIETSPPFIGEFLRAGGMTTGCINGKDIHGRIIGFRIINCTSTGEVGKEAGIGRGSSTGVFRVCVPSSGHTIRLGKSTPISTGRTNQERLERGSIVPGASHERGQEVQQQGSPLPPIWEYLRWWRGAIGEKTGYPRSETSEGVGHQVLKLISPAQADSPSARKDWPLNVSSL